MRAHLAGHNLNNIDKTYLNYSDSDLKEAYLRFFHAVSLGKKIIKPVLQETPPEEVDKLLIRIGDLESELRKRSAENDKYVEAQRRRIELLEQQGKEQFEIIKDLATQVRARFQGIW
jgi:hypothetical protein